MENKDFTKERIVMGKDLNERFACWISTNERNLENYRELLAKLPQKTVIYRSLSKGNALLVAIEDPRDQEIARMLALQGPGGVFSQQPLKGSSRFEFVAEFGREKIGEE